MEPEMNEMNTEETREAGNKVTKEMLIHDLLQKDPDTAMILMGAGMGCIYCPASQYETIEEACLVHGIDADDLIEEINTYLENQA